MTLSTHHGQIQKGTALHSPQTLASPFPTNTHLPVSFDGLMSSTHEYFCFLNGLEMCLPLMLWTGWSMVTGPRLNHLFRVCKDVLRSLHYLQHLIYLCIYQALNMCWLLNLTNALYFLGKKHCGFGPQVHISEPRGRWGRGHTLKCHMYTAK